MLGTADIGVKNGELPGPENTYGHKKTSAHTIGYGFLGVDPNFLFFLVRKIQQRGNCRLPFIF
jgi:hypothetical protein